ncbi:Putative Peroxisomal biogenesis factor 11 [[Torrubiella] hemipterigena]|uniref:Putative Peroxisomal biogenesis factor 11 n=1 Tax=[Torrubiella] hemipterigena TaxID=1531966 RepID=A0A0A1TCI4_9HYPO|nr:Putative Peroxisomal biogenesis factor 11 [[Torrubiella] hemipterigena]
MPSHSTAPQACGVWTSACALQIPENAIPSFLSFSLSDRTTAFQNLLYHHKIITTVSDSSFSSSHFSQPPTTPPSPRSHKTSTVFKMVADALVYHPSVAHYLRFVATTVGRDKVLRLIQYFARFYSWYLLRTNATTASINPWDAVKKQLGLARKVMRFGKNIEHVKAAAVAADAKSMDPVLRYAAIGRQLGYAGYLTFDALTLPDAIGFRKSPSTKTFTQQAQRFWAMGITFSIAAQLYTLYTLKQREQRIDRKDGEGVVESKRIKIERATSQLQLLSDFADLTIPTSGLGWTNFDDGFIGLAGTLSSAIGIYNQWRKTT